MEKLKLNKGKIKNYEREEATEIKEELHLSKSMPKKTIFKKLF